MLVGEWGTALYERHWASASRWDEREAAGGCDANFALKPRNSMYNCNFYMLQTSFESQNRFHVFFS
jgi:hypothetical protein